MRVEVSRLLQTNEMPTLDYRPPEDPPPAPSRPRGIPGCLVALLVLRFLIVCCLTGVFLAMPKSGLRGSL